MVVVVVAHGGRFQPQPLELEGGELAARCLQPWGGPTAAGSRGSGELRALWGGVGSGASLGAELQSFSNSQSKTGRTLNLETGMFPNQA